MSGPSRIRVASPGAAAYDVLVGHDLAGGLPLLLTGAERVLVLHPESTCGYAGRAAETLRRTGLAVAAHTVPDGEAAKGLPVVAACWEACAELGLTRSDAVVAVGGGATTDLAGFVAATWLRGVRVVHLPTTLLGMVDAAVGGKTGINVAAGKNLVGSFHPPAGVLCDLDTLATMPAADYASGLAEVVKAGFIADPAILDLVESDPAAAARPDGPHTAELVRRSVQVKADVVSADLRESKTGGGGREFLNYGHTLAHAIERVEDYRWRHGDAVSVGLVYAAAVSSRAAGLDQATAARHGDLLAALGLPTRYRADAWPALLEAMRLDKKNRGSRMRFVALSRLGEPTLLDGVAPGLLADAYADVADTAAGGMTG